VTGIVAPREADVADRPVELRAFVDGIGFWSPATPCWEAAVAGFRGAPAPPGPAVARPLPAGLAANERRRAPDSVLVALAVAEAAVAASGRDAHALAHVFSSAHGDLPIVDALCRTLAQDARLLSPTRFHHSVHNAAAGYWAIASGCRAPGSALAAFDCSFAHGLLEALVQQACEGQSVLLVGFDTEACGRLAAVNASRSLLGMALVLAPHPGPSSRWALQARLRPGAAARASLRSAAARSLAANASADALPLAEALAGTQPFALAMPLGDTCHLALQGHPFAGAGV
jgi:hypothetical protein